MHELCKDSLIATSRLQLRNSCGWDMIVYEDSKRLYSLSDKTRMKFRDWKPLSRIVMLYISNESEPRNFDEQSSRILYLLDIVDYSGLCLVVNRLDPLPT